jgi:hypothetical protein
VLEYGIEHKKTVLDMIKKGEGESSAKKRITKTELEEMLIGNFVSLQKVLTDLSSKFDMLSGNISRLLELFEASAKSLAEKQGIPLPVKTPEKNEPKMDKELLTKLDVLLDQNKTIARGLTLIEGKLRETAYDSHLNEPTTATAARAEVEPVEYIGYPGT